MYVCMYVCMYIYKTQQRRFIHPCVEKRKGAVVFPTAFLIYLISGTLSNLSKAYPITTTKGERNNGQQHTHVAMKSSKRDLSSRGLLPTSPEAANGSLKIPTSILFESLRLATHKAIFSVTAKTSCLHTHRNHQSLQDLARVSCMSVLSQYWKQHLPIYPGPFWHGKPPGPSAAAWSPLLWRRRAVMISGVERTCSGQIRRFFLGRLSWKKKVRKWKLQYFNSPTSSCLLLFVASQFSYWWFHVMPPFSIHSWVGQLPLTAGKNVSASTWACPKHSAWCGGSPQSFTFRRAI